MWIVDRSKQAAENGEVWRPEDHLALVYHLKQIDSMAQALVELELENWPLVRNAYEFNKTAGHRNDH